MTPEAYRNAVLAHEGQLLANAGHHGEDHACTLARSVCDGAVNALIRMKGPRAAALFAFALADRASGGVTEPADSLLKLTAAPHAPSTDHAAAVRDALKLPAQARAPRPLRFWTIWIAAWLCGLGSGLTVAPSLTPLLSALTKGWP